MPTFSQLYGDGANRCSVAISNSYDSCGTITRADVAYATPEGLASIFKSGEDWRDMKSLLSTQMELKTCGIPVFGIYDWLMSSAKSVGSLVNRKKIKGTDSLLEPFILAQQKSLIRSEYWAISSGWDGDSGAYDGPLGATPGTSSQRIVRIISRNDLDADKAWFTPKGTIHIFSKSAGGTAQRGQWKIISSAASGTSYVDLLIETQNGNSTTPYEDKPGQTVSSRFNAGVVVIGTNNVNDFESWCNNRPALNPNRNVPFWFQTSRYTLCVDEHYKEWLNYMLERNPLFAKFGDVSLAERNRQLGMLFQKEWVRSFFWGKPLPNQSLANWQSLEQVNSITSSIFDTGTENKLIAYKANAIGVYEQLRVCGRVRDLQGQKLNLREFFDAIYDIYRSRSNQGKEANSIDIYTDRKTAASFQRAMVDYYNEETTNNFRYVHDMTGTTVIPKLGFRVRSYELVYPQGVTLNIITDNFFDDFVSAAQTESDITGTNITATARFLMVLDLGGGIYPGIIASNRKVHTVGQLSELAKIDTTYACVMENPTREVSLNSLTWTAIVECPSDNLIVENFSDEKPAAGDKVYPYQDLYN